MDFFSTLVLGLVEGITEFLPISSTAHLMLLSRALGERGDFNQSFIIAIQTGAIAAVAVLYFKKLLAQKKIWRLVACGFVPTAIIGWLLYRLVKNLFLNNLLIVALALIIGGIVIMALDRQPIKTGETADYHRLTVGKAMLIGVFQALGIIPGVSRAGATIIGALALGLNRATATEFSFLLAIPTMLAATGYDLFKSGLNFNADQWGTLAAGALIAFASALAAIKFFIAYLKRHNFFAFGVYRLVLGLLILAWLYLPR